MRFRKPFTFASASLTTTCHALSSRRTSSSWLVSLPCCSRQSNSSMIRQTFHPSVNCANTFTRPTTSKRARSKCSKFSTGHCTDRQAIPLSTSSPGDFSIKSPFNMKNASSDTWLGESPPSPSQIISSFRRLPVTAWQSVCCRPSSRVSSQGTHT